MTPAYVLVDIALFKLRSMSNLVTKQTSQLKKLNTFGIYCITSQRSLSNVTRLENSLFQIIWEICYLHVLYTMPMIMKTKIM